MSTWVVEHGMVPLLVPEVFPPVDFSMQAHVFFGDTWHYPYIFTCFYTFYGVQAAFWQFEPEALEESDASHMQPCIESKDRGSS